MKEEFEYGELVEVRDFDDEEWLKRYYIDTLRFGDTGLKWYCTHDSDESPNNHKGYFQKWAFIRKIQNPEPDLIDIEQPEQGTIEYLQGQIHTLNKRLMVLENEFHIKSMNKPVKTQLK